MSGFFLRKTCYALSMLLPDDPSVSLPMSFLKESGCVVFCADLVDAAGNGVIVRWGYKCANAPSQSNPFYRLDIVAGDQVVLSHEDTTKDNDIAPAGRWRFDETQIESMRDMRAHVVIARINAQLQKRTRVEGHFEMGAIPRKAAGPYAPNNKRSWSVATGPGEGRAILTLHEKARFRKEAAKQNFHLQGRAGSWRAATKAPAFFMARAPFKESERFVLVEESPEKTQAFGIEVDVEGRSRELALEIDGDLGADSFVFREAKIAFLGVNIIGRHPTLKVASFRAPMQIPAKGFIVEGAR